VVRIRLEHRPLRRGILGGIAALVVMAVVTGVVLAIALGAALDSMSRDVEHADNLAADASQLRAALLDQETGLRGYQLTGDDAFLQPYRTGLRNEQGALDALILDARSDAVRTAAREAGRASETWRGSWVHPQLAMIASGDLEAVREAAATGDGRQLFDQVRGALGRVDLAVADVRAGAIASLADTELLLDVVIALAVAIYIIGLGFGGYWIVTRVSRPLDTLVQGAEALERGEPVHITARRDDEIGKLAETIDRLHQAVQQRYAAAASLADQSMTLNRLSELISYASDEEAVIRAGRATLQRLIPSRGGEVLLVNPSFDQLRLHSTWGEVNTPDDRPLAIGDPRACPGIRRNAVHLTRSALDAFSLTCEIHPMRTGSLLCIPMISHNEVIGVIHLERADEDGFTDDDVRLSGRVTEQVALAMANLRLMDRMERQAMTDPLTGLANPRSFDPLLERELAISRRDQQPVAVLMMDLDDFKRFNDTHGHPAGDEALRSLARTVRGTLRETDAAARYGGEEFAILLRATSLEGAVLVAEKLRAAIAHTPVEIGPNRFARITASLGVAASDRHGTDRMQLMHLADVALYEAKTERNRVASAPVRPESPATDGADGAASASPADDKPTPIRRRLRGRAGQVGGGDGL